MAYNKSKYVENAQKFLHQGKVAQAIAEYLTILKHEPRDQVTLMTIGDLYVRQGETFQALEYFERLAKIFLNDGFVAKAIAIYKKIAKLAPEETRPVERLAELYVQQGVLSEARPIYLQLAELHERAGRQAQAAQLLRKLLDAEPDNLRVQTRLAALLTALGKPAEAAAGYFTAAEQLHRRGDHVEAIKHADLALGIRANDVPISTLKARALVATGKRKEAEALLQALPDIEEGGEAADLLLDFYIEAGQIEPASELVLNIFSRNRKQFAPAQRVAAMLLETEDAGQGVVLLDRVREAMTDAGEHEVLSQLLVRAVERLPQRIEVREWLVELYGRASDSFRLPDALANLAEAYEAAGQHDRAQQTFQQLLERNPEDERIRRKCDSLQGKTGAEAQAEVAVQETPATPAPQTKPAAAQNDAEPELDEQTQIFVSQSLTDVDLFSSYGLTQKAIDLLEVVLVRAPQHTPTLERLLDLSLGAGDERRIAELASRLEKIHTERGHAAPADRFAELRRRFERAAGRATTPTKEEVASSGVPQPPEFAIPPAEQNSTEEHSPEQSSPQRGSDFTTIPRDIAANGSRGVPPLQPEMAGALTPNAAPDKMSNTVPDTPLDITGDTAAETAGYTLHDSGVHEIDLSEEWAALAGELGMTPSGVVSEFEIPERPAQPPSESSVPSGSPVSPLSVAVPEEHARVDQLAEVATPAENVTDPPVAESFSGQATAEISSSNATPATSGSATSGPATPAPVLDPRMELAKTALVGDDFLTSLSDELGAVPEARLTPSPSSLKAAAPEAVLSEPVLSEPVLSEVDMQELSAEHAGPLNEVFNEFRAGLDDGSEEEDPETHYNLGIAYREMGLAEESISEFQKVAQMIERQAKRGHSKQNHNTPFRYAMQCCTLLGLAFMEKGEASIAAAWYARALDTPGLEQDSVLALRYDLGVAQEQAGDVAAARKSFSQVYGTNIDYRDVAERLAALGKGR